MRWPLALSDENTALLIKQVSTTATSLIAAVAGYLGVRAARKGGHNNGEK